MAGGSQEARSCERVGVLGGTFDPIHIAHLVAALGARHALGLDRVLLVVAGDPWQKRSTVVASAADRLAMARAAIDGLDGLEVSAIEVERAGPTYTIDTLRALTAADRELFLIVGDDVAARLDSWHEADAVRSAATLVVVARDLEPTALDPATSAGRGARVDVQIPRLDIASSDLRGRVARGEPIDVLVPSGAVRVIRERRLYTRS
jgi:nicotinate-nucleotide adenylyltransferase